VLIRLIDKVASVCIAAVYSGALIGVAYCVALSVKSLSGQNTSILFSYLTGTHSGVTVTVSIGVGVIGTAYGIGERLLHRRTIAHFAPLISHYQQLIDPNRTSSGLTMRGTTKPEDI